MFKRLYAPIMRLNLLFDGLSDRLRESVFLSIAGLTLLVSTSFLYLADNPLPLIAWAVILQFVRLPYLAIRERESKTNKYND